MAVLLLAVVGVLVWAGVYNHRKRVAEMEQAQATLIKASNDPMNSANDVPAGLGKDLRGKPMPGYDIKTVDGAPVTSAELKGHPVVINFWATYCGPCKLEMPWFEEFSKKYAAQGLKVVGIDDEESVTPDKVKDAAKKIGVSYPILIATSKTESDFGLGDYLPVTFYVDANGVVQVQTAGAPSKDQVEANIKKILGGAQ